MSDNENDPMFCAGCGKQTESLDDQDYCDECNKLPDQGTTVTDGTGRSGKFVSVDGETVTILIDDEWGPVTPYGVEVDVEDFKTEWTVLTPPAKAKPEPQPDVLDLASDWIEEYTADMPYQRREEVLASRDLMIAAFCAASIKIETPEYAKKRLAHYQSMAREAAPCVSNEYSDKAGVVRDHHTYAKNGEGESCVECGEDKPETHEFVPDNIYNCVRVTTENGAPTRCGQRADAPVHLRPRQARTIEVQVDPEIYAGARELLLSKSNGSYNDETLTEEQVVLALFYMCWNGESLRD